MSVKLTEKKTVSAMNTEQTFLIVVDGAIRRLSLGDLQKMRVRATLSGDHE